MTTHPTEAERAELLAMIERLTATICAALADIERREPTESHARRWVL